MPAQAAPNGELLDAQEYPEAVTPTVAATQELPQPVSRSAALPSAGTGTTRGRASWPRAARRARKGTLYFAPGSHMCPLPNSIC